MKVVGITGGIGSGKTTVARVFASMSIPVFNSDAEGRRVLDNDARVIEAVKQLLGEEVYLSDGKADRKAIASKVFADPAQLENLNAIIHPAVKRSTQAWVMSLPASTAYCLKEAAILFESGAASQCDQVIAVRAEDAYSDSTHHGARWCESCRGGSSDEEPMVTGKSDCAERLRR